jgi:DNA-binding SARP family transcriptional activator
MRLSESVRAPAGTDAPGHGGTMDIRFLLLGQVGVEVGDAPVVIDSTMLRGLLGTLLLHANQFVAPEQLSLALWDAPPPSAASNLRTYVARLRGVFARHDAGLADRLSARRGSGYRLEVGPGELDHKLFRALAANGRAQLRAGNFAAAADLLARGLAMWRGASGHDVPPYGYAVEQLRALNDSRLAATEDHLEARLALGDIAHLVADLRTHVALHPLRERPYGQLIRALYRGGDPSGALAVYNGLRRLFDAELGIEPGAELQSLHRAVLCHDEAALSTTRLGPLALAA